jgi:hypothetical protein
MDVTRGSELSASNRPDVADEPAPPATTSPSNPGAEATHLVPSEDKEESTWLS